MRKPFSWRSFLEWDLGAGTCRGIEVGTVGCRSVQVSARGYRWVPDGARRRRRRRRRGKPSQRSRHVTTALCVCVCVCVSPTEARPSPVALLEAAKGFTQWITSSGEPIIWHRKSAGRRTKGAIDSTYSRGDALGGFEHKILFVLLRTAE